MPQPRIRRTRIVAYFVGVTSLQAKVDEINTFFSEERSRTITLIILVMAVP